MAWRILGIGCCLGLLLWVHRGPYPRAHMRPEPGRREWLEALALIALLLVIPYLRWNLLWYTNWLGPYLMLGLWAPFLFETLLRNRDLTLLGVAWPLNARRGTVSGILALFLLSKIVDPLHVSAAPYGSIPWSWSTLVVFPLVEEILFRGVLQIRLEALWGPARAWVGSGLLFGAYHYYVNYLVAGRVPTGAEVLSLLYLVALGMLLGAIAAKTRSLLPSLIVHAVNNLTL